jgi:chorismate mutase
MPPAVHTNAEDRRWMADRLADGEHEAWVATLPDGRIAGYALLTRVWLDHLFVAPDHLGLGIGTALLEVVKSLRADGFCLWVFESNTGARRFYARHGLVELERTDGTANEERAPDIRMVWPGADPLRFLRGLIDEVDEQLGDLLARRAALTRAVQGFKTDHARDPAREREIAEAMARRAPALGAERLARIVHTVITESLDAARD